jgi:hypothetical protein
MTTTNTVQELLFQRIRGKMPQQHCIADTVSEILHVSYDSAYRRIRGETPLVLEEAAALCRHFNLSLDQVFESKSNDVLFRNVRIRGQQYSYRQYLEDLHLQLAALRDFRQKEIIYISKDLPLFHNFYFRPLIAFRYFFWMKVQLTHPDFEKQQFDSTVLPVEIEQLSRELARIYCGIPSTEIWNTESINSTISQIEFSRDSGHFSKSADIKSVYEALEESIQHIKSQAEQGCKFMPGESPVARNERFSLFYNRVVLGDNTIMVIADSVRTAFINYGNLNYIETTDEEFCNDLCKDFNNLIRRSTQLSQSSERQRNHFFNILFTKIKDRKYHL